MSLGAPELLIVLAIVLLLFGSTKLPHLARSLGQASREFKKGTTEAVEPEREDKDKKDKKAPAPEAAKAPEMVTMSREDLDRLIAERETKAEAQGSATPPPA